jgi:hypothetical protein
MDLRERIEEAKASRAGLDELERDLTGRLADVAARVGGRFAELEAGTSSDLIAVRRLLNAARTLQALLRDLRAD